MSALLKSLRQKLTRSHNKKDEDNDESKVCTVNQCDSGSKSPRSYHVDTPEEDSSPESLPKKSVMQRKGLNPSVMKEVKPRKGSTFSGEDPSY